MIPGSTRPDLCVGGVVGTIYDVSFPGHSLGHCTSRKSSSLILSRSCASFGLLGFFPSLAGSGKWGVLEAFGALGDLG